MRLGARVRMRGLSLIELMIAMMLGLLVVGGAIGVFLSNQRTYRATESIGRIQENARVAFELMARDVRAAGGNACARTLPIANVLTPPAAPADAWWSNLANGIRGYEAGELDASVDTADAVEVAYAAETGVTVEKEDAGVNPASIHIAGAGHDLEVGDIVLVCDYRQASMFQMSGPASGSAVVVNHNKGNIPGGPGNCTKGLGFPVKCGDANGTPYKYGANSKVVRVEAARWFVADNGRGGNSLYRVRMDKGAALPREEIVEGVSDLELQYLTAGAAGYVDASAALPWANVVAARITLTMRGTDNSGVDAQPLQRTISHVVTLRNRIQ